MTGFVIIDHHFDPNAECYRIAVAVPVYAEDGETIEGYTDPRDFVFDSNDARWFNADGVRRPASDVAAEQREEVRVALGSPARESDDRGRPADEEPEMLPGIGDSL